MDLKDLRVFLHLARSLHFGRTAREFHMSASTLTRIVQKLEHEAGAELFERDNRTVRLTQAGTLFCAYAQHTLGAWADLQQALHRQHEKLQGRLSVFCSVTASYSFLHDLLDAFRARYPEVEIRLHTGDSALAIQRILDEEDDVSIAARPDRLPHKLQFHPIAESPLVFIAPASPCPVRDRVRESLAAGQEPSWHELPFILSETGLARTRLEQWFRRKDIKPQIYAQVSGNEAIVSMVSLGFGIGVVPQLVVENSPISSKIEFLSANPVLEPFAIGICSQRRKLANPLIKAFWELSRGHFAADEQGVSQSTGRGV